MIIKRQFNACVAMKEDKTEAEVKHGNAKSRHIVIPQVFFYIPF